MDFTKDKRRALRRYNLSRMKKKSIMVAKRNQWMTQWDETEACNNSRSLIIIRTIKHANHLKMCSCHMCGNPRKHYKDFTFQEIKFFQYMKDELF